MKDGREVKNKYCSILKYFVCGTHSMKVFLHFLATRNLASPISASIIVKVFIKFTFPHFSAKIQRVLDYSYQIHQCFVKIYCSTSKVCLNKMFNFAVISDNNFFG